MCVGGPSASASCTLLSPAAGGRCSRPSPPSGRKGSAVRGCACFAGRHRPRGASAPAAALPSLPAWQVAAGPHPETHRSVSRSPTLAHEREPRGRGVVHWGTHTTTTAGCRTIRGTAEPARSGAGSTARHSSGATVLRAEPRAAPAQGPLLCGEAGPPPALGSAPCWRRGPRRASGPSASGGAVGPRRRLQSRTLRVLPPPAVGSGGWVLPLSTCVKPHTGVSRAHSGCHAVGHPGGARSKAQPLSPSWASKGAEPAPWGPRLSHPFPSPLPPGAGGVGVLGRRLARGLCPCWWPGLGSIWFSPATCGVSALRGGGASHSSAGEPRAPRGLREGLSLEQGALPLGCAFIL